MRTNSLLALALTGLTAACATSEPETSRSNLTRATPTPAPGSLDTMARDDADFGFALYREVRQKSPNLIASPYSISSAVAMLWGGARGTTESAIATALHFSQPQAERHAAQNVVDAQLAARNDTVADAGRFELRVVNDLWAQRGFAIAPTYLDLLATQYGAGVRRLDFDTNPEVARATINDWVAQSTRDRIQDLFPEGSIDSSTVLALTNAVYFKARWAKAFDASNTVDDTFNLGAGGTAQVPFMKSTSSLRHVATADYTAVELPYAGNELALLVILPKELTAFEDQLSARTLGAIVSGLQAKEVSVRLPKWKHELSLDLAPVLKSLGMAVAFSGEADLTGIDPRGGLFVQAVVHKAFIEVNEDGTEAAAATGISVGRTSVEVDDISVSFDRPFIYVLRDLKLGTPLFVGRVSDPR